MSNPSSVVTYGDDRRSAASAGVNSAIAMSSLHRNEEALQRCTEVVQRFGADTDPEVCEQVAKALRWAADVLGQLNRGEEALQQ
jgi:hypothetical protein